MEILAEPHDTDRVKFVVSDTGTGIKSEDFERLCEEVGRPIRCVTPSRRHGIRLGVDPKDYRVAWWHNRRGE